MDKVPRLIVPIITPFDKNGKVYERGVHNLLHFLHRKGIRGIWILGSYGAFPLMDVEDRLLMAEIALKIARELGFYTIVQIGSPGTEIALKLALHAQDHGTDSLSSTVPFYFSSSHYKEENFLSYFEILIDGIELPLIYYNNPKTTGYTPSVEFVKQLLQLGVQGMKDTTTDFLSIAENIQAFREVKSDGVYMGGSASVFLPARIMGAPAVVCGTGVSMPEIMLQLDNAVESNDMVEANRLQHLLIQARAVQATYVGRSVACYDVLNARGVDVGVCKSPWIGMASEQCMDVVEKLKSLRVPGFD